MSSIRRFVIYRAGLLALRVRQYRLSLRCFEVVLDEHPDYLGALYNKAWALAQVGRFEESAGVYSRIVRLAPLSGAGRLGHADALQRLERHEEAIAAFDAALELEPDNVLAQYNRAHSLTALGRDQDALVTYRRLAHRHPEDAWVVGNLGATLGRLGHWEDALEHTRKAMALEPSETHAYNLGVALFELERFAEAEAAFARALSLNPVAVEARIRLALCMASLGRTAEAVAMLGSLLAAHPANTSVASAFAGVLILDRQMDAAADLATRIVEDAPALPLAHEALGWVSFKKGDFRLAVESYDRAISLAPEIVALHAWRGAALSRAGRTQEALASFAFALRQDPCVLQDAELRDAYDVARASSERIRGRSDAGASR